MEINKIRCFLGLHMWEYSYHEFNDILYPFHIKLRYCEFCHKKEKKRLFRIFWENCDLNKDEVRNNKISDILNE